ncbi:MAG: GNAT family N-acetyltransferase [Erysipelotrichaceae bacterium]|nr:GNAT family N-acetyltransferase [Erysipelotrichaceae bacterium]
MIVEKMQEIDLPRVAQLEALCFRYHWSLEQCIDEYKHNPYSIGFLVKEAEEIFGYAFLWEQYDICQLSRIGIDPKYRHKKAATFLLETMMKHAKQKGCLTMSLDCRVGNRPALALYESCGFQCVHVAKKYYSDGEDAAVMVRKL